MTACLHFFLDIDTALFYLLNVSLRNPVFDLLMPFLTTRENWLVPLGILWIGLLIWGGRNGRIAALLMIPLIVLTDQASSHLLKPLVQRIRPCNVLGGVHLYMRGEWTFTPQIVTQVFKRSFSFPSSHATNIFAAATLLSYAYRRWTPFCLAIAASVAYSRVYVGVHYPSDVLAGAVLGTGCAFLVIFLWRWREQRVGSRERAEEVLTTEGRPG